MSETPVRALELDDLFRIRMISDPQLSPDGQLVTWVETWLDKKEDTYFSALWIANADGTQPRKLTSGMSRDTAPRWSPQGDSIAFVSNRAPARKPLEPEPDGEREKDAQNTPKKQPESKPLPHIWVISIHGGEAVQATNHPAGAGSFTWSPDGKELAFTAQDEVRKDAAFKPPVETGVYADERLVHDIRYRFDGAGWLDSFAHIWTVRLDDQSMTQRTDGDANDGQPAWSPDGSTIAFIRSPRETTAAPSVSTLHLLDAGTSTVTAIGLDFARFDSPVWSPSGDRLAFFRDGTPGINGENTTVCTIHRDGSGFIDHTQHIDTSFADAGMSDVATGSDGRPRWIDEHALAVLASSHGATHVYRIDLGNNAADAITRGKRRIMGFDIAGDRLVFTAGYIHRPTELFVSTAGGGQEQQATHVNDAWLREVRLAEAIELDVTAADGTKIQTWLLPPHDHDPESPARYPLILQIHGGPHAMYSYAMFHEMQLMAAKNYGVVFCNPRGSSGYGEAFTMCTRGTWGESDMPDVMAALDAALAQPWVDPDRIGITGGSYGGYLTNWIIGHTDRFKAAVTQRCVSSFLSFFGTSDIGFDFGTYEPAGTPWADTEKLLRHSPISYVDKIDTPLLIIHSEQDLRCPIEQAEQMFASLRYLGKEVSFVRIPNEGHELSRSGTPSRRLARLQHMIGWFDSHL
jgi:dipeptidyl aminopeptidase/acylaminoacyl peptidase